MHDIEIIKQFGQRVDDDPLLQNNPGTAMWAKDQVLCVLFEVGDLYTADGRLQMFEHIGADITRRSLPTAFTRQQIVDENPGDIANCMAEQEREIAAYAHVFSHLKKTMQDVLHLSPDDVLPPAENQWRRTRYQPPGTTPD